MLKKAAVAGMTVLTMLAASPVLAQGLGKDLLGEVGKEAGISSGSDVSGDSLPVVIGNVIEVLLTLLGAVFLVLMVYAGYLWMIARGDTKTVEKAKDTIKQAIIGIIIVSLAYVLTGFVVTRIEGAAQPEAADSGLIDPYPDP